MPESYHACEALAVLLPHLLGVARRRVDLAPPETIVQRVFRADDGLTRS
jgi:hypothetical protein